MKTLAVWLSDVATQQIKKTPTVAGMGLYCFASEENLISCGFGYPLLDIRPNGWFVGWGAEYDNRLMSWFSLS
jgi:hypothetical protein